MSTTVPKFISAEAESNLTFTDRVSRIRAFFGLPAWVKWHHPESAVIPTYNVALDAVPLSAVITVEPMTPQQRFRARVAFAARYKEMQANPKELKRIASHQLLSKPIPGGTKDVHVVEFPPEPIVFADYALPVDHEAAVIARVEIAQLSKPSQPTTKTKILTWIESFGGNGVSVEAMCNAFPEYTRGAISSRVSEMVRENSLIELGRFLNSKGAKVTFYTRAETN